MASFDAKIKVLLDAQQAYKEIEKIEKRIQEVSKAAIKPVQGPKTPAEALAASRKRVAQERRRVAVAQQGLKTSISLASATELYERRLREAARAGTFESKSRAKAVENAKKVAEANKDNVGVLNRVNTLLGRINEKQREINRNASARDRGQRSLADANAQIKRLRDIGFSEGRLKNIIESRDKLIKQIDRNQFDFAKRTEAQLKRRIQLIQKEIKEYERLGKQARSISSPIQGRLDQAGSPRSILANAARSPIGGSKTLPGSPKYIEDQVRQTNRLAQARERLNRAAIKNAAKSPIKGGVDFPGSPKYIEAQTKALEARNKAIIKNAIKSPVKGGADFPGSPKYIEAQTKAEERRARKQEANQRRLDAQRKRADDAALKRLKKFDREQKKTGGGSGRISSAAIGGGFPLLFGGGPGSVIGGLAGGALGGKENGFAASVALSALGTVLDRLGQSAIDTGTALIKPTTNLEKLTAALGITGTGLKSNIELLEELGLASVASSVAVDEFQNKYGKETADTLRNLGKEFITFQNAITTLGVRISALLAGPLGGLLNLLSKAAGSAGNAEVLRQLEQNLSSDKRSAFQTRLKELTGGAGISGTISDATVKALSDEFDPEAAQKAKEISEARLRAEKVISEEIKRQVDLAKLGVEIEAGKLTNRRDDQATLQGSLAIQRAQNESAKILLNYNAETERTKRRILALEYNLSKEAEKQAEEAQRNARIQAERAIQRDLINNQVGQLQISNQLLGVQQQSFAIQKSAAEEYEFAQLALGKRLKTDEQVLEKQRELALIGVTEVEVQNAINQTFNDRLNLLRQQAALRKEELRQAEQLRQVERLRFEQSLKQIQNDAQRSAASSIRQTDPENVLRTQAAGFGFFGDSQLFSENRLADSAAQLEQYNEKIANLRTQIAQLEERRVDPDKILPLQDNLRTLVATRDAFQQLQPEIDAAAIKQARFNDAFKVVAPIAQSALNGIQAVVAGTKTAEEAFADFLKSIADLLLKTAAEMIATYIAVGIARQFALGGGGGQGSQGFGAGFPDLGAATGISAVGREVGGRTMANMPYVVGEKGAELFVPGKTGTVVPADVFEATRQAIAGNGPEGGDSDAFAQNSVALGNSASVIKENTLVREMGMRENEPIDVRYESTVINNVSYVSEEQFQKGLKTAVAQSKSAVFSDLKNKPSSRAGVGLR